MPRRLIAVGMGILLALGLAAGMRVRARATAQVSAQATEKLPLQERVLMVSKIYRIVSTFFPHLSQEQFDARYTEYVSRILGIEDRREFDLASMEFVAGLHDGHTWFYDNWLDRNYGQPIGFTAYPMDGQWVVMRSQIDAVKAGDVIERIDDRNYSQPIADFYAANRKYVSASSDRDAGVSFFDTPAIFPEQFTLTLDVGRQVAIDRAHDEKKDEGPPKTEGRWLAPGTIAYVKVPVFRGIDTQAQALGYFREFHSAKAIILDLRGNPGLGMGTALQGALMTKPYNTWNTSTPMKGGVLLRDYSTAKSEITTTDAMVRPREPVYTGPLFLLIDRGCTCACEDFVMPFKVAKRAVLVGETTAGSFSSTSFNAFENGMLLNVASIRHTFPDGSQFEGVGIAPDVEIHPTAGDLKAARDVVLGKAVEIAGAR